MADFFSEPSEIEVERPERARPVPLVGTGVHPTADLPTSRTKEKPPATVAYPQCGQRVLRGALRDGRHLTLDTAVQTYTVLWTADTALPCLEQSRTYPLHACQPQALVQP